MTSRALPPSRSLFLYRLFPFSLGLRFYPLPPSPSRTSLASSLTVTSLPLPKAAVLVNPDVLSRVGTLDKENITTISHGMDDSKAGNKR
ncbi:hypothetical protein E2C01_032540 [Portunus trituberculatus]|uniref:Uncharacterized protein n=1 Tax=Portunus trituberculatus TaxID=210409 RepID=A0A5B7EW95_PORTR|nr:hypothetical protein [Portunus trituberculatus]